MTAFKHTFFADFFSRSYHKSFLRDAAHICGKRTKNVFSSSEKAMESGDLTKKPFFAEKPNQQQATNSRGREFFFLPFFTIFKLSLRFIPENARSREEFLFIPRRIPPERRRGRRGNSFPGQRPRIFFPRSCCPC